ncbi:MAG: hypothetical protein AAB557_00760 [Patescibacteria group bacterium]
MKKYLFILLAVMGLAVRIYFLTRPGFFPDMESWRKWAVSISESGLFWAYTGNSGINYPPVYLGILWGMHALGRIFGISFGTLDGWSGVLFKLPPLIFDIGVVFVLAIIVWKLTKNFDQAALAGLIYWMNPAVVFIGTAWGQVDSVPTFFLLLALYTLLTGKLSRMGFWLGFALATKVQTVVVWPVFFMLLFRRSVPETIKSLGVLVGTLIVIHAPFIIAGQGSRLMDVYFGSVGFVTSLSHNAWNLWWPIERITHLPDTGAFFIHPWMTLSYRQVGFGLLGVSIAALCLRVKTRWVPREAVALLSGALLSFFILPTQIHERYAFPAVVFLGLYAVLEKRWILFISASLLLLANLVYVFPLHAVIGRGVSWSTILYKEEFGFYAAFVFVFIFVEFFREIILRRKSY